MLAAGLWLWRWIPDNAERQARYDHVPFERTALVGITLLAGFIRFWRLPEAPPGLTLDEGRGGLCALALLRGDPILPFTHVSDTFSLFPTALGFSLFGPSVTALRAVAALYGTLTIPALWWLVRPLAGSRAALVAAALLATSGWHVALSRVALSCVQYPLATVVATGLFLRAWNDPRPARWAWFGLALGAGFHAYVPGRVLPVMFACTFAALWLADRKAFSERAHGIRRAAAVCLAGIALFGWYLFGRPDLLLWRFEEVAGESTPGNLLSRGLDLLRGLAALNGRGDGDLAHMFPDKAFTPLLGVIQAACWLPGLQLLLSGAALPARCIIGAWMLVGFAGAGFGGPHTLRMGALVPLTAACAAVAITRWGARLTPAPAARGGVFIALVALSGATELRAYLPGYPWGHDPDALARSFRMGEGALAARLVTESAQRPLYLGPEFAHAPGTDIERFAATPLFLAARAVQWHTPAALGDLKLDRGAVIFPLMFDVHADLLAECFPGGAILAAKPLPGVILRPAVYAATAREASRAKLDLADYGQLAAYLVRHDEAFNRKQYPEALAIIDAAISGWPRIGGLHVRRGRLLTYLGRYAEAERDARRALARGAVGAQVWLLLGNALAFQDRPREAAEAFAHTVQENPLLEEAWYNLAVTRLRSGQRAEAQEALRASLPRFPRSARLAKMGWDLLR